MLFLSSDCCPVNLLGRDLMLFLGISLISTPDGLQVVRNMPAHMSFVQYSSSIPLHVYEWKFPLSLATDMLNMAHAIMPEYAQFVSPEQLHCTAYGSQGPDPECDKRILCRSEGFPSLLCRSVISVTLSSAQQHVFLVENSPTLPCLSLLLKNGKTLGPFTLKCTSISDWEPTGDTKILYSPSTGIYKRPLLTFMHSDLYTWPCKQQYPLKQEAIDGITPVFNSLLQAGIVIVPCNDSPVHTPIFPVKKVRDEGAPTEWRPTLYNEALRDSLAPLVLSPVFSHSQGCLTPLNLSHRQLIERDGCMTSVLLQTHGDKLRPVAYFSAKLDPVAAGHPRCLRAVAAAEKALLASRDIVGYAHVTLLVPSCASDNRWQLLCLLLPPSPCTPCNPGDFVVVKDFRRKHWQAKRWHGPFQILLTTHTAVKVAERATWVHMPATEKGYQHLQNHQPLINTNTPLTS
ncbi:hypothetical protein L3Q82_020051, partial [Scortum barcoo]